jgi:hypothetical protein
MGVAIEGGEAVLTLRAIERPHMTSEFLLHGHQEMGAPHYHFFSMGGAGAQPVLGAGGFAAAAGSGAAGAGLNLFFKGAYGSPWGSDPATDCQESVDSVGCAEASASLSYQGSTFCELCADIVDCTTDCSSSAAAGAGGDNSTTISFSINAGSLAEAQSSEGAIKTAIAGVGGVSEDSVTVAITAATRRLLATGVYTARARPPAFRIY